MSELYPQIKHAHILLALISGTLFAVRGAAVLMQARWHAHPKIKLITYIIDIALLTAAFMLLALLPWTTFENGWLLVKVTLIVAYVLLGVGTMRLAKTRLSRAFCYVAALLIFGMVYSIARAHHPLGIFSRLIA